MEFEIIISRFADNEIDKAIDWYEMQQLGLGIRFAEEAQQCLNKLAKHPQHFSYIRDEFRQTFFKSFPYKILFKIEGRSVRVMAVFHTGQNDRDFPKR